MPGRTLSFRAAAVALGGLVFCGALVAGSSRPLIRVGVALAALGLATAWLLASRIPRRTLRIATGWCWLMIIVIGTVIFLTASRLGGSALSGTVTHGTYQVMEHGQFSEVTAFSYSLLAGLELLMFLLVPAGVLMAVSADKPSVATQEGAQ